MIVMPANNTGRVVKNLFDLYPDRIALLLNPHEPSPHQFKFRFAVDNAAYSNFDEPKFFKLLDKIKAESPTNSPMFVVVPDVVGCHYRTLALWKYYYPILKSYDFKLAFVAQDGCILSTVPPEADWIFIGGTDLWKVDHIKEFITPDRPVHVGRVNSLWLLEYCESVGVASVDGSGWMRARHRKFNDLMEWFKGERSQKELWPADPK